MSTLTEIVLFFYLILRIAEMIGSWERRWGKKASRSDIPG